MLSTETLTPEVDVVTQLHALLHRRRFRYRDEVALHEAIGALLDAHQVPYEREVRVPGGRVDFVVGTVAIEVKIKGSSQSLSRQLQRYVDADRFTAIIVATTRPAHHVVANPDQTPPITVITLGGLGL